MGKIYNNHNDKSKKIEKDRNSESIPILTNLTKIFLQECNSNGH